MGWTQVGEDQPMSISFLPGMYRVHFITDARDGEFYFDVEVKKGTPHKVFVRAAGPKVSDGVRQYFTGKWMYPESLVEGGSPVFNGKYRMQHTIRTIEPLINT
jgi:hypothetical protein